MTPCTRLACFGSRVSVSLPDCCPGPDHDGPVGRRLLRPGPNGEGVVGVELFEPEGPVRRGPHGDAPVRKPHRVRLDQVDRSPLDRLPGPVDHDAVERHGPRELEVGPVAVGSDVEPGTGLGVEPEMALRRRARLDQYLSRRDVDRVAPLRVGLVAVGVLEGIPREERRVHADPGDPFAARRVDDPAGDRHEAPERDVQAGDLRVGADLHVGDRVGLVTGIRVGEGGERVASRRQVFESEPAVAADLDRLEEEQLELAPRVVACRRVAAEAQRKLAREFLAVGCHEPALDAAEPAVEGDCHGPARVPRDARGRRTRGWRSSPGSRNPWGSPGA